MNKEISDFIKNHIEMLVSQTKAYQPFIKTAFPAMNMADACMNLIAANAFSVFLSQYSMRMLSPTESDYMEFGTLIAQYVNKINEIFPK